MPLIQIFMDLVEKRERQHLHGLAVVVRMSQTEDLQQWKQFEKSLLD